MKKNYFSVPENLSLPNQPDGSVFPAATEEEDVRKGIMSFYAWASAGPDHLHFRSLMAHGLDEAGSHLLSALTDLVNVMLRREVKEFSVPILYGENECGMKKRDSGISPIAFGSTEGCPEDSKPVVQAIEEELRPVQL